MNAVHIANLLTTQTQFVPAVAAELHSAADTVFAQAVDVTNSPRNDYGWDAGG